ncbi:MAG TPA: (Fe-S)-binding protein [Dehalococcoidales bacterium]|nr:(Fe-S)-binding protein [Dehalococcoidales bacterium]
MKEILDFPQIDRFKDDLGRCTKCGFCMSSCPVYREEKLESAVARGKIMLIRALQSGDIELTDAMAEKLNQCTLCMTCTQNCPASTQVPSVITAARADRARRRGLSFPYNVIFRWLLPRRRLFGRVVRLASWFQGIFLPRTQGTIRHLSFFLSALGQGRHIPQVAPRFLRQQVPEVNKPPAGVPVKYTVGYFTGCMTDYVFPELGKKIIGFLTRNGVEVHVPRGQGCCGAPVFLGAGDFATGRKMADTNVKAFEGLDYVITDCATCASAMKDYAKFLADSGERQRDYTAFADKIKDITEFLVDVLQLPPSAYRVAGEFQGKTVTWHEPCHLGRYLGVKEQPRKILKSMTGIKYVEMPEADRCCGMAGTFSVKYYDLSRKIADRKIDNIASTGADIVVTDCPGCEVQLIDGVMRHQAPQKVMHIMELLALPLPKR